MTIWGTGKVILDANDDDNDAEVALLAPFGPNADALLRRISGHVDDATLQHIAELDAGMGVAEHLRELRQIRDRGILRHPFGWEPREVLELVRYFEPEAANPADRGVHPLSRKQAHWARAFAGAALIRALGDDDASQICDGCNFSLIQMLESLRVLEAGLEREAMAALAWLILRLERFAGQEEDRAFAGVGMVALAVQARNTVDESALFALAEWVIAEEQRAFDFWGEDVGDFPGHWLLRTSLFAGVRHQKWVALGAALAAFDGAGRCGDVVRDIGGRLTGKPPSP